MATTEHAPVAQPPQAQDATNREIDSTAAWFATDLRAAERASKAGMDQGSAPDRHVALGVIIVTAVMMSGAAWMLS